MKEIWTIIPEYPSYRISNKGRVKRIDGIDASGRRWSGKILKPVKTQKGYNRVTFSENGKRKHFMVHRLVMLAFNGPCFGGLEIDHINENKSDNRLKNLRYVDHITNVRHGSGIERSTATRRKPVSQLSLDGDLIATYQSMRDAERITGICNSRISECCKGKSSHAGGYVWQYEGVMR